MLGIHNENAMISPRAECSSPISSSSTEPLMHATIRCSPCSDDYTERDYATWTIDPAVHLAGRIYSTEEEIGATPQPGCSPIREMSESFHVHSSRDLHADDVKRHCEQT